jgi:predicted dehydrogenase
MSDNYDSTPVAKLGVIGCGNISDIYLEMTQRFKNLNVVACADLNLERAQSQAQKHGIARACTVKEMLDSDVDVILNLTIPAAHFDVASQALEAGKHVYNEKPLTVELSEARALLELARSKGLQVGGAPDTFLGAGLQTARALIDEGAIGRPINALGSFMYPGHERWHPNPAFYYQHGGGPLFDMGPYYLTALVALMGPIAKVSCMAHTSFPERVSLSGERIKVETPTHISTTFQFVQGGIGTLIVSFDAAGTQMPHLEVFGAKATLSCPNPNFFEGPVKMLVAGENTWLEQPLTRSFVQNSRGIGVSEMMHAVANGRQARASGELTAHVLEVMHASLQSDREGRQIEISSRPAQPAPLPADFVRLFKA